MELITILGATGSIGENTLDVIARHPNRFQVYALSAFTKIERLFELCKAFHPVVAVVATAESASLLQEKIHHAGLKTEVLYGPAALCEIAAADPVHTVMAAIVGAAGLAPVMAAAKAGKKILLANKEALVMAGGIFLCAAEQAGAKILPVDSEHNAIFQCLPAEAQHDRHQITAIIHKIILTASGGPFRTRDVATLTQVTVEDACAHPNWVMGRKISVDSATMMNKGLEVIEAHYLFALPKAQIDVLIHPQSIVHSLVAYPDGSLLAQMGEPDMRIPIAHTLGFPRRIDSGAQLLDLTRVAQLNFEAPNFNRFPCLALAFSAMEAGNAAPIILNAANEVAVTAFLAHKIKFTAISAVVAESLERIAVCAIESIDAVFETDKMARQVAEAYINQHLTVKI